MKKVAFILLTTICLLSFTVLGLAQYEQEEQQQGPDKTIYTDENGQQFQSIKGRIIAIDREKNEILLQEDITHNKTVISVPQERMQDLKLGNHVRMRVKVGTNIAIKIVKVRIARSHK